MEKVQEFFNVYRIDLISPSFSNDTKDVRNSALEIDLKLEATIFLLKDQTAVDSILKDLNIKADTRVILMGEITAVDLVGLTQTYVMLMEGNPQLWLMN